MSKNKGKESFQKVDPSEVRFTHSKIRRSFSCGRPIVQTLEEIKTGKVKPENLPKITVIVQEGVLFSMNNRRLWLFKQCKELNLLKNGKVEVRIRPFSEVAKGKGAAEKFTPERYSLTAKFMSERKAKDPNEKGAAESSPTDGAKKQADKEIDSGED